MHTLDPQALPQHVDRLYRAAWALCGSREDAEDLVQETFARVLARRRVLRGDADGDLYYLLRVLRNTFLTSRRTASRRPQTVATLDDVAVADPTPRGQPESALEVGEVYATIASLPEDFRLTVVAIDVLGLSYREAARALQVREATITTRLHRARKQIAERLLGDATPEGSTGAPSPAPAGVRTPSRAVRASGAGGAVDAPGGRRTAPTDGLARPAKDAVPREGTGPRGVLSSGGPPS
jgi:RNA polymerase sigma-70 factor (ECF subfamily)